MTAHDRIAKETFTVLLRPKNNVSIGAIPRKGLAAVLASYTPHASLNGLTSTHVNHRSNSVTITFYNKTRALAFCEQNKCKINDETLEYEVYLMHPKGTCRGLIQVDPGDSDVDLRSQTTCESAVILDIRHLGKTNYALVMFDTTASPRTVRNYLELCKVKPYVPRTLVCYRCHRDGHLQKHWPNPAVCSQCGRSHEEDQCPDATPYCNLCKKTGHTARDTNCQLKISRLKITQKRTHQRSHSPPRRHITGSEPSFPRRQYNISSTVDFPHLSQTPDISPTTARLHLVSVPAARQLETSGRNNHERCPTMLPLRVPGCSFFKYHSPTN
ncbi:hypothetical protein HPB48_006616 [Haemaphysalis longicornis]|uniref:CCHC-type domain-containing protein n=1 Tax=Haemaphysalis longicornis TaxID=44386 RepID=A0A9J6GMD3_HAELO|nr:hypothetical protein HPB48_006616 [Haemaphysalis longicornis]